MPASWWFRRARTPSLTCATRCLWRPRMKKHSASRDSSPTPAPPISSTPGLHGRACANSSSPINAPSPPRRAFSSTSRTTKDTSSNATPAKPTRPFRSLLWPEPAPGSSTSCPIRCATRDSCALPTASRTSSTGCANLCRPAHRPICSRRASISPFTGRSRPTATSAPNSDSRMTSASSSLPAAIPSRTNRRCANSTSPWRCSTSAAPRPVSFARD